MANEQENGRDFFQGDDDIDHEVKMGFLGRKPDRAK